MTSMLPLQLPSLPTLYPSFQVHRGSFDTTGSIPALHLSQRTPTTPIWAALPSPPMSGSPVKDRRDPSQLAGQRRKRSETPPVSTTSSIPIPGPSAPFGPGPGSFIAPPAPENSRLDQSFSTSYHGPQAYGYGSSLPTVAEPQSSGELRPGFGQISPRTRKTKAHVASACVNCKKKHLRCDSARPCRRCTQSGKEDSCVDVAHKKRGRPPLKAEESASRRSFEGALSPLSASIGEHGRRLPPASASLYPQGTQAYHRDIRPIRTQDFSRPGFRGGRPHSMYAAPTMSSSSTTLGAMIAPRLGYSNDMLTPSTQASTPYVTAQEYSPMFTTQSPHTQPHWGTYAQPPLMQQGTMLPPSQSAYQYANYPRTSGPLTPQAEAPIGFYGSSSLQLPPIRPAPQGAYTEPALAQQQRQAHQPLPHATLGSTGPDDGQQPDAKRPRMDIKGILDARND